MVGQCKYYICDLSVRSFCLINLLNLRNINKINVLNHRKFFDFKYQSRPKFSLIQYRHINLFVGVSFNNNFHNQSMSNQQLLNFPFINARQTDYSSYPKMLQTRFVPNFEVKNISTVIIAINAIIFILMHTIFRSGGYMTFLQWPVQMDPFLLEIEKVKANPLYIYQAFTAIFMHKNYLHIAGNIVFAMFVMYEMEHSWKPSIFFGLLAGFAANCLAVVTLQGRFLGFSGVLTAYVGMIISIVLMHCSYLRDRLGPSFCILIFMMVLLTMMVIGFGSSLLIHLYGFIFGLLLGFGFYPRLESSDCSGSIAHILKMISIGVVALVIGLALIL